MVVRRCRALSSRRLCRRYRTTASAVSYGQHLTTFWRAGISFPRSTRTGRLNGTFATPFDLVFPEREYATIWRCFLAEPGVQKLPKVTRPIDGQVSTCVCLYVRKVL